MFGFSYDIAKNKNHNLQMLYFYCYYKGELYRNKKKWVYFNKVAISWELRQIHRDERIN